MNLDAALANKVARTLSNLDGNVKLNGLHVGSDGITPCLLDGNGDIVARLEYDAETGKHKAVRW